MKICLYEIVAKYTNDISDKKSIIALEMCNVPKLSDSDSYGYIFVKTTKKGGGILIDKIIWLPSKVRIDNDFTRTLNASNQCFCIESVSDKICKTKEEIRLEITMMSIIYKYAFGSHGDKTIQNMFNTDLDFRFSVSRTGYYSVNLSDSNRKAIQYFMKESITGLTQYVNDRLVAIEKPEKKKHKKKKRKD